MDWEECLKGDVVPTAKNKEVAKSLLAMCEARLAVARGTDMAGYPALRAEAYYEVTKELITALLVLQGFKSYSHKCLIAFMHEFHLQHFSRHEVELMDKLRKLRNDIDYRGVFTGADFLERNEKAILAVIGKLFAIVKEKIK